MQLCASLSHCLGADESADRFARDREKFRSRRVSRFYSRKFVKIHRKRLPEKFAFVKVKRTNGIGRWTNDQSDRLTSSQFHLGTFKLEEVDEKAVDLL